MKKLTAGIFAGILTIVGVNAAHADIASKAYVDKNFATKAALETTDTNVAGLTEKVGDATGGLVKDVADLQKDIDSLTGGSGSVANQIADALGDIKDGDGETITVKAALDTKQDKSTSDFMVGMSDGKWQALDADQQAALNSKITTSLVGKITTNESAIEAINNETNGILATSKAYTDALKNGAVKDNTDAISAMNTKIGTLPEGATDVVSMIEAVETAATDGVDEKLGDGFDKDNTVADALAGKADVNSEVAGSMITTNAAGQIVALNPTESQAGTYVLTATVADGKATYYWENITRGNGSVETEE